MRANEWSRAIASAAADSADQTLLEAENLAIGMAATRYLALVSLTFLLYDMLTTMGTEVKYVWATPWNFGRIAFHFNRLFAPSLQTLQVISLFRFHPSPQFCIITSSIYVWGTCATVVGVMSVLVARVWLLYFRKPWVLVGLLTTGVIVSVPPLLIILVAFRADSHIRENPAPDVIPGCMFSGASKWTWIPYVGSTLYESLLFGLTVYKVYNAEYELPIINRLYRDGTCYYVVVLAANIFTMVGSRIPLASGCATGSGFLGSIMATMCNRILLSTKSFETERRERAQDYSISETIRVPRSRGLARKDSSFWGIIEVDRTTLYIKRLDGDSERGEGDRDSEQWRDAQRAQGFPGSQGGEFHGSQLRVLPVMFVPGGPGLRSGWARRDSEGEIIVAK